MVWDGNGKKEGFEMKKVWLWILGAVLLIVIGVIFLFITGLLRSPGYPITMMNNNQFIPREEPYWRNYGFQGGMHRLPTFGVFGMLIMLALPVGFVVLLAAGVVLLVQSITNNNQFAVKRTENCGNCGRPVENDWRVCPNCGETLRKDG